MTFFHTFSAQGSDDRKESSEVFDLFKLCLCKLFGFGDLISFEDTLQLVCETHHTFVFSFNVIRH